MADSLTISLVVFFVSVASCTYDFVVKPEFGERQHDLNITSYVGQTTRLPCTVKHLSGKRVSWIRQRDLQVLSTGRVTFSTDLRISVLPGTRFKIRKPRGLSQMDSFSDLMKSKDLDTSGGDIFYTNNQQERFGSRYLDMSKEKILRENEIITHNQQFTPDQLISSTVLNELKGNKNILDEYHTKTFHDYAKCAKRNGKDHSKKHPKRQKKHFHAWRNDKRWPAPILNFDSHNRRTPTATKSHDPVRKGLNNKKSVKGQKREILRKSYTRENNPIAIYPQGPVSAAASDGKAPKLAPNYIDGVWEPEDYTLQIKYTKPQDAGIYICQINTEPRITQAVILRVVRMRAEIVGRRELFVKAGNPVKLSCRVNHGALSPGFILWYKGDRLVEYENSGGRIQVQTEAGGVSHLILKNALQEDSSNYTCSPAGGAPASLNLNVIVDERPAAMQQGNSCPSVTSSLSLVLPNLVLSHILQQHSSDLFILTNILYSAILLGIKYCVSWQISLVVFLLIFVMFYLCEAKVFSNGFIKEPSTILSITSNGNSIGVHGYYLNSLTAGEEEQSDHEHPRKSLAMTKSYIFLLLRPIARCWQRYLGIVFCLCIILWVFNRCLHNYILDVI